MNRFQFNFIFMSSIKKNENHHHIFQAFSLALLFITKRNQRKLDELFTQLNEVFWNGLILLKILVEKKALLVF